MLEGDSDFMEVEEHKKDPYTTYVSSVSFLGPHVRLPDHFIFLF